jgi:hypothetical protein
MRWELVLVAVLGAGGPVMWFLTRFDRRNTAQHAESRQTLERIEHKIDRVDERLDGHIGWHLGSSKKDVA